MTLLSLFKNTDNNNPHTLLWGPDAFLNDYLTRSYSREQQFAGYERVIVDCEADGLDDLLADLTESSLFSQQKLITIKNPFFLTAKVPKKFQRQLTQLENVLSHINELDNVVVISASYEKIDRRKKLTKTVLKNFNVVETQIKPYEVGAITKVLINAEGFAISQSALQLLVERSDQVMDTVLSNYSKLKMAAEDKKITKDLVEKNVDLSLAQNIFAILEAALRNNYHEAITRLTNQLHQGSNPVQLLAVFENQIELILVVKILAKRGRSEAQISKELAIHPYRVKLALRSRLQVAKLTQLLETAIKLDFNYKNGQCQSDDFLKMFILNV
ncbi:DNA polymerase III subunit delta [Lactobacillus sp. ESL0791]|uniref:DNA polymerase III subunit delta n=1 Tax=Lactobacillus sp. ESL0791 TaxID=2983234 RepID=UPI0023F6D6A4|nr:DNA polymerase III subunit delta [Lactobacillus sp. ESL0791]MDF7638842.1 DNA polymerase III subunit delta [Lactobacillus sp. ESL0791]